MYRGSLNPLEGKIGDKWRICQAKGNSRDRIISLTNVELNFQAQNLRFDWIEDDGTDNGGYHGWGSDESCGFIGAFMEFVCRAEDSPKASRVNRFNLIAEEE